MNFIACQQNVLRAKQVPEKCRPFAHRFTVTNSGINLLFPEKWIIMGPLLSSNLLSEAQVYVHPFYIVKLIK